MTMYFPGEAVDRLDLDQATSEHPVWVAKGGHVGVANSLALHLAGITSDTPDPPHGTIKHAPDGTPTGELYSAPAMSLVSSLIPPPPFEQQVQNLKQACQVYNSYGIGTVRDPIVTRDQMLVYQALWERGGLTVRSRPMFLFSPGAVAEQIADIRKDTHYETMVVWVSHAELPQYVYHRLCGQRRCQCQWQYWWRQQ